jgi:hypothetical protein
MTATSIAPTVSARSESTAVSRIRATGVASHVTDAPTCQARTSRSPEQSDGEVHDGDVELRYGTSSVVLATSVETCTVGSANVRAARAQVTPRLSLAMPPPSARRVPAQALVSAGVDLEISRWPRRARPDRDRRVTIAQ